MNSAEDGERLTAAQMEEARARLRNKLSGGGGSSAANDDDGRTGGKFAARRKKRPQHKASGSATDDRRLQQTLKRLNVNTVPSIEEVNMFKSDNTVIHFNNPKVQAAIQSNTYAISGHAEIKNLSEILPQGLPGGLGQMNEAQFRAMAESIQGINPGRVGATNGDGDDDDVPDLVDQNFEDVSKVD